MRPDRAAGRSGPLGRRAERIGPAATVTALALLVGRLLWTGWVAKRDHLILVMPDLFETLNATIGAAHLHQFVGAWSRTGLYHPGPAWFYWAAPFIKVFGPEPSVLFLAALTLAATCIVGIVVIVWRNLGWPRALLTTAIICVCVHQMSVQGLSYPWNPTVLIMPAALGLAAATSAVSSGSPRAAIVGVLAGAFVAQAHIGAFPLGILIIGVSLGAALWGLHRACWDRRNATVAAVLVACTVLPWLPVIYDQVSGTGNFGAVVDYAVTGDVHERFPAAPESATRTISWEGTAGHFATLIGLTEPGTARWAGADFIEGLEFNPGVRSVIALLVLLGLTALGAAPRRRSTKAWAGRVSIWTMWLCRVALAGAAVQALMFVRIRSEFRDYFVAVTMGVGVVMWTASAQVVAATAAPALARLSRWAPGAVRLSLSAAAVVLVAVVLQQGGMRNFPGSRFQLASDAPALETLRARAPAGLTFHAERMATLNAQMLAAAVLSSDGHPPRVEGPLRAHFSDFARDASGGTVVRFLAEGATEPGCRDIGAYARAELCLEE